LTFEIYLGAMMFIALVALFITLLEIRGKTRITINLPPQANPSSPSPPSCPPPPPKPKLYDFFVEVKDWITAEKLMTKLESEGTTSVLKKNDKKLVLTFTRTTGIKNIESQKKKGFVVSYRQEVHEEVT